MKGKIVTCVWAGEDTLQTGKRYEVVDYKKGDGIVAVIDDKGKRLWTMDSHFDLSGEDILTIRQIEFNNDYEADPEVLDQNYVTQVFVTLTDQTQWVAVFYRPRTSGHLREMLQVDSKDALKMGEATGDIVNRMNNMLLKFTIRSLYDSGEFYTKFSQIVE